MGLPALNITVLDGNLNLQAPNNSRTNLILACCTLGTPNTLYAFTDQATMSSTLGYGKLAEAVAYQLAFAGGPVLCMPVNPGTAGGFSAVTQVGTGAATLAVSAAPHATVAIACTTSGTLGTAKFTFQVGSGPVSSPVTSASGWSSTGYAIPGTYTTWVATAGSYTTSDTYQISTLGVVTHPAGSGPAIGTQSSSPIDNYNVLTTITKAGALATSQFTYSLDNTATNTSSSIVTTSGGTYAIPNTGIVLTYAGTAVLGDTYAFTTCGPTFAGSDLTNATNALETTYLSSSYSLVSCLGAPASGAAWATQIASMETAAGVLFNNGIYVDGFTEVPTVGSISASGGVVAVDSADTDSSLVTTALTVTASHMSGCAGDLLLISPLTGLQLRRNCAWAAMTRASGIEASRNIGDVSLGGLSGVTKIYRDENATPALDAARYTTVRTFPGAGATGFYMTDGHTFAVTTSDYFPLTNARVIAEACSIVHANALRYINSKVLTKNDGTGSIAEKAAQIIEGRLNSALKSGMIQTQPQDAVAVAAQVNRSNNIISSQTLMITVAVTPFGYARTVNVSIGLTLGPA